jgi:TRAP-type mannitol/chloroaromatic compound transport system permease large subunit
MAMSAYYLKGISPPHVQLTDIFRGMMPYMAIVIFCMIVIYVFPQTAYYLPSLIYGR